MGDSTRWQYADQSKVNDPLFNGPADWISPGFDDQPFTAGSGDAPPSSGRWFTDPPASDGTKVVITDTDHYAPGKGDALWAWKSFLRGHNTILMDFGLIGGVNPSDPSYASFEPARYAMGDTRRYAERMKLIDMVPRGDLTSTGYALAHPGTEYLVLQPSETNDAFEVRLAAGSYSVEWYNVKTRETKKEGKVSVDRDGSVRFTSPFAVPGPAVLYLSKP